LLKGTLEQIVHESKGIVGLAAKHLQTGEEVSINENRLFPLASVFKVPVLAEFFRQVETGRLQLDQRVTFTANDRIPGSGVMQLFDSGASLTFKDLATLMIVVSDNAATDKILDGVGIEQVNRLMSEMGMANSQIRYNCWKLLSLYVGMDGQEPSVQTIDEWKRREQAVAAGQIRAITLESQENNVSTVTDMNMLLERIAKKEVISVSACEQMIDIMSKQQFRNRIPYLLPAQTKVAHKTGTIGSTVNDAGIVRLPKDKGDLVISIFTEGNESVSHGERMIARLSRAVYDYFADK